MFSSAVATADPVAPQPDTPCPSNAGRCDDHGPGAMMPLVCADGPAANWQTVTTPAASERSLAQRRAGDDAARGGPTQSGRPVRRLDRDTPRTATAGAARSNRPSSAPVSSVRPRPPRARQANR